MYTQIFFYLKKKTPNNIAFFVFKTTVCFLMMFAAMCAKSVYYSCIYQAVFFLDLNINVLFLTVKSKSLHGQLKWKCILKQNLYSVLSQLLIYIRIGVEKQLTTLWLAWIITPFDFCWLAQIILRIWFQGMSCNVCNRSFMLHDRLRHSASHIPLLLQFAT